MSTYSIGQDGHFVQFEWDVKGVCDRDTLRQLADQYPRPSDLKKVLMR